MEIKHTYYGITGAPGEGPRLDGKNDPAIETIEAPSMIVNEHLLAINCSDEVLQKHINRAREILDRLIELQYKRQNKIYSTDKEVSDYDKIENLKRIFNQPGRGHVIALAEIGMNDPEEKALRQEYVRHLFNKIEAH